MEELNINLEELNALDKYFDTLKQTGYYKQKDVDKLLVLDYIRELLSDNYSYYITEEDFNIIKDVLYCLFGSTCLISYPVFIKNLAVIGSNKRDGNLRITEDEILRKTENDYLRIGVN